MLIEAVFVFGAVNAVFEFVLLGMLPPRTRLRLLGSETACMVLHALFLVMNLFIHWGTLIGTMSAVIAFIASMLTVYVARKMFGFIRGDRFYHVGWFVYADKELM